MQQQAAAFFSDRGLSNSHYAWQAVLISCLANLAIFSVCCRSHLASRLGVPEHRTLHWSQRAMKAANGILTASGGQAQRSCGYVDVTLIGQGKLMLCTGGCMACAVCCSCMNFFE